jgi:hypothetical protein
MGIEPRQRALLVGAHQAAIAGDVAGEDGG